MKILFIFLLLFASGCQTLHVTKQYYDEYINPKAEIDYDEDDESFVHDFFFENYYGIDSKLVSLKNKLDMTESVADPQWFEILKESYPWVINIGFFDNEGMFVSGSDSFAYDSSIREMLDENGKDFGSTIRSNSERFFLINALKTNVDTFRYVITEIDFSALSSSLLETNMFLVADGKIFGGDSSSSITESNFENVFKDRDYSGSSTISARKYRWIRSHAANNLVYFYAE